MPYVTINKEAFLDDLYNSSSHEEVMSKIQKEKSRVEKVKSSGEFIPLAQLHLTVVGEIEFYMINKFPHSDRNPKLNERIAKLFAKFPIKK